MKVETAFRIDPEFRSLIPPLMPEELAQLEENLKRDGCRDPLVTWNAILVDGHNRYEICSRLGIPFQTTDIALEDRDAAKIWIIQNQFGRRNLTAFVTAELTLKLEPLIAARTQQGKRTDLSSILTKSDPLDTRAELAKISGLSAGTIHKAKTILERSSEEVKQQLRTRGSGTSINREYEKIRLQERDDKKKAELQLCVEIRSAGIIVGDFREKTGDLADNCAELVFIDPPYDRESAPLYEDSARIASRILKPGGSLIAYCGQYLLPEILPAMQKHLRYWWMNACVHSGAEARMQMYGVVVGWKPMVWFTKGARGDRQTFVSDVVSGGREKSHHQWQQAEAEAAYYIERLTSPGGLVIDFFAGGGTTAFAAAALNRPCISFEINPATAKRADERLTG